MPIPRAAAVAVLAVVAAAGAAAAGAQTPSPPWAQSVAVSRAAPGTVDDVAIAPGDRGLVTWSYIAAGGGRSGSMAAELRPDGSFGPPRELRGRFGRPIEISRQPACRARACAGGGLAVAVGARGDLVVAWDAGGHLVARVRRPGQRLGPVVRIGKGLEIGHVQAAVTPSGTIWLAWQAHPVDGGTGNGPLSVGLATRPAGAGAFSPAQVLQRLASAQVLDVAPPRLAIDRRGGGFLAWSAQAVPRLASFDPRGRRLGTRVLSRLPAKVAGLAAGRRPGEVLVVARRGIEPEGARDAVVAWFVEPGGVTHEETVGFSNYGFAPVAAFDPRSGAPLVVWPEVVGPGSRRRSVVLAARRAAAPT